MLNHQTLLKLRKSSSKEGRKSNLMAAMNVVKNAFLGLSKSPEIAPLRPAVSKVCFVNASRNHQQGRNIAGEAGRREYSPYNADESVQEPRDEVRETMDKAKEKTREMKDRAKESADDAAATAKERADKAKDKTMDAAGNMADKTKGQAHEASEKVKGAAETAADKTKEYAHGAKETTKGAAEKVADAAKGAWGAAKETTQKIKETVVGKSDDGDLNDFVEDHVKKPAKEHRDKVMDEDVIDARRRRADDHNQNKF